MSVREEVVEAVRQRRFDDLEAMVAANSRAIRYLVSLTYQDDVELRRAAARGLALASRHHPRLLGEVVRRLAWAMNDESGTHAVFAPGVLCVIAEECPEILLPVVPDLMRLSGDPGLHDALVEVTRLVAAACPGEAAQRMQEALRSCGQEGERGRQRLGRA